MLLTATQDSAVEAVVGKLDCLAPLRSNGIWVTRGRMRKGMVKILGVEELPILLPNSRLAHLVMKAAHEEDYRDLELKPWLSGG